MLDDYKIQNFIDSLTIQRNKVVNKINLIVREFDEARGAINAIDDLINRAKSTKSLDQL